MVVKKISRNLHEYHLNKTARVRKGQFPCARFRSRSRKLRGTQGYFRCVVRPENGKCAPSPSVQVTQVKTHGATRRNSIVFDESDRIKSSLSR